MEVNQMVYFLRVAQTLNFTRAAEELYVSQPALSRQVKLLEAEFGVVLFERLPQGLKLTPAGEALREHCQGMVDRLTATRAVLEPYAQGVKGTVTIGCLPSLAGLVAPVLAEFIRQYPAAAPVVRELATSDAISEQLHAGDVDLGIGEELAADLERLELMAEPLLVALPQGLLPAAAAPLPRRHLTKLPFVLTPPTCSVRRRLEAELPAAPNGVLAVEQLASALQFAATGVGAALVPASVAQRYPGHDLRFLAVDPALSRTIYAGWRPDSFVRHGHPLVTLLQARCQGLAG